MQPQADGAPRIRAVAFDLLTALLDSVSMWATVIGNADRARTWRAESLRIITTAGDYTPYEDAVRQATANVGLPPAAGEEVLRRWGEVQPWPETTAVLRELWDMRLPLAVVTNCSQALAEVAAKQTGGRFTHVISAQQVGAYKPDPRSYRAAADAFALDPAEVLFVAGSAHDVPGASAVGMPVYWSNRLGLPLPAGSPQPLVNARDLTQLPATARRRG